MHAFSLWRCCFFLLVYLMFTFLVLGVTTLIIIYIMKPQQPVFSIQALNLDSYKLDVYSSSSLFVSSVISMTLNAENRNRVGIRYSASRLQVLNEGLVIGMIRVPGFYQPARSSNVSVQMRVMFQCVNISQIMAGVSLEDDTTKGIFQTRIVGDIRVQVLLFHFTLAKVKVAMDCDVDIDIRYLAFRSTGIYSTRGVVSRIASFPTNAQTFSKKCSFAIYI